MSFPQLNDNYKNNSVFFSIIINCHNGQEFLCEALDSVFAQTFKSWEVIFYDNKSTDDSVRIAKKYGKKVTIVSSETFIPLGKARNNAIQKSSGKFIAFLDSDDIWEPSKLSKQFDAIERANPINNIGICYSDSMRINELGNPLTLYSYEKKLLEGDILVPLILEDFLDMSTVVVSRKSFIEVGLFDERYNLVEDWDMWIRIARNFNTILIPEPLVKTRIHPNNLSTDVAGHVKEMVTLVSTLNVQNKNEKDAKEKSLKNINMRSRIYDFIISIKTKKRVFVSFIKLINQCFIDPKTTFKLVVKYLNIKMIKIIIIRAGKNGVK